MIVHSKALVIASFGLSFLESDKTILMAETPWPQIIASFAGGGLAGAALTAAVTNIRSRVQPVAYRIDRSALFQSQSNSSKVQTRVAISEADKEYQYDNLHFIKVEIINKGNLDRKSFPFGLTLHENEKAVAVEGFSPDRQHVIKELTSVSPNSVQNEIDFVLEPFNRGDIYIFNILVVLEHNKALPNEPRLISSEPVRFTKVPSAVEILSDVASSMVVSVGFAGVKFVHSPEP